MTPKILSDRPTIVDWYLSNGINLFPLQEGSKKPNGSWDEYQQRKYPKPAELKTHKGNLAVVCGKISGNLRILDIETWDIYERFFSTVDTFTVKTPNGGVHLYYKADNELRRVPSVNGWPVEIRGEGHYCLSAGSVVDGRSYEIIKNRPITTDDLEVIAFGQLKKLSDRPNDIAKWKQQLVLKDVVEETVELTLQPKGYYKGLCPFHNDNDPSLAVYDGNFYCFGCGKHGDVIDWVQARDGLDFKEAVKKLANGRGIEPPALREGTKKRNSRQSTTNNTEESGLPIIATSFIELRDGRLVEEVFDDGRALFAIWDGSKVSYAPEIDNGESILRPLVNDAVTEGAVKLPTRAEDYGTDTELINEIQAFIHKYLDISKDYEFIMARYIATTWLYDRMNVMAYARFLGDWGSGKTRGLDVIGGLCYKPCMVSGAVTPAPIYRIMRQWKGTMVIDEADFIDTGEKAEIIKILNSGFEKGKPIMRCDVNDPDNICFYPCYGPKVIATRREFEDKALESRCMTETMERTDRDDIPKVLGSRFNAEQATLRNKLLTFRFRHYKEVNEEAAENMDLGRVEPRLKQAMQCMGPVLFLMDNELERFKEFVIQYNQRLVEGRGSTFEGMIVRSIKEMRDKGIQEITSATIASHMEHRFQLANVKPDVVGARLRTLKIETKRTAKARGVIVWDDRRMKRLFERYVPQETVPVTPMTPHDATCREGEGGQKLEGEEERCTSPVIGRQHPSQVSFMPPTDSGKKEIRNGGEVCASCGADLKGKASGNINGEEHCIDCYYAKMGMRNGDKKNGKAKVGD